MQECLETGGPEARPFGLYWLQILDWALNSGELELNPGNLRMPRFLGPLRRSDAKLVQEFLEKDKEIEGRFLVAHPNKDWEPEALPSQLFDYLDSRLSISLANHQRANPLH